MNRFVRYRRSLVVLLALLSVFTLGSSVAQGRAAPRPTRGTGHEVSRPTLTYALALPDASGTVEVMGQGFTPGGRVFVALFDPWDVARYPARWTTASPVVYGPNGSRDPAIGYSHGGNLGEVFGNVCGTSVMVRAYDKTTNIWSNALPISPGC